MRSLSDNTAGTLHDVRGGFSIWKEVNGSMIFPVPSAIPLISEEAHYSGNIRYLLY